MLRGVKSKFVFMSETYQKSHSILTNRLTEQAICKHGESDF